MIQYLNIVTFDIPYPANYGGAIDVFYRLQSLSRAGVKIILHCTYKDNLTHCDELERLCDQVFYYKRKMSVFNLLSSLPIAVESRRSDLLLQNLCSNDYPILFEGLVTCLYLNHPRLKDRLKLFRECNVEHDYYRYLAASTTSLWKKLYYRIEARRLQRFEPIVTNANTILALSHDDEQHFRAAYPQLRVVYLPCSHPNEKITATEGHGDYILYHGNLELAENENAALYICSQVIPLLHDYKFIVAGRRPTQRLKQQISKLSNVQLIANPTQQELDLIIRNAQVHLLITSQPTGLKLKLLNVLYAGRFVVVNSNMIAGTELSALCLCADTAPEQAQLCRQLMDKSFSQQEINSRSALLSEKFDNSALINRLLEVLNPTA